MLSSNYISRESRKSQSILFPSPMYLLLFKKKLRCDINFNGSENHQNFLQKASWLFFSTSFFDKNQPVKPTGRRAPKKVEMRQNVFEKLYRSKGCAVSRSFKKICDLFLSL